MARHNIIGQLGEQAATEYLIKKGYIIRERNWRFEKLEVDIIAEYNNRIVFVEVKTRTTSDFAPNVVIDDKKRLNLLRAANLYLRYYKLPLGIQIDVVFVTGDYHDFKIEHIPDAIRPKLRGSRCR